MITAITLAALAVISLGVAASLHFGVIGGPDFREALVVEQEPLSLDPLIGEQDPAVRDVGHLLYRSLLQLDAGAVPRPDLARQYSVSADGLTYRLTLAPGQRWSSGGRITPADVAATFAFLQTSTTADRRLASLVQGVKLAVTGSDVVFTLPAPHTAFGAALTQVPILPFGTLSTKQLAAVASRPNQPLATSGAYRVAAATDAAIDLERNPHATARAGLGRIRFDLYTSFNAAAAAYNSGGADAVLAATPQQRATLLKRSGSVAHSIRTFQFVDLLFNERVPGLDDLLVRGSIALAVNRAAIIQGALDSSGGAPQVQAISEGLPWAAGPASAGTTSAAQASAYLQQDGWSLNAQGTRVRGAVSLSYSLTVPDVEPLRTVAAELATQLAKIGVTIRVTPVPADHFVSPDVQQHDFQLALGDWDGGPDPDVSAFWRSNATPPQGFNVSGSPVDPFLDQALDVLATSSDPQARISAAASVSRHLVLDATAVFLYTPEVSYVVHASLGAMPIPATGDSTARFDDIAGWRH